MKRIVIVGATSAIATACARRWAEAGARLFLVGRDPGKLDALARDLTVRSGASVHAYRMDANDVAAHPDMVAAAIRALGGIDVALIAHGTLPDQAACESDTAMILQEFATNGTSAIALLSVLANHFERQGHGAIGVITSVAGDRGRPSNYVYGSAKAAVSAYCEGLRGRLYRSGVTVTDVRPGFVATPMTRSLALPAPLVSQPDTVARRIVNGIERGADVVYAPAYWRAIMLVVRSIPRAIFKRMKL